MKPPVDTIRFSSVARNQLILLKRRTGIETFNILARWGFCYSVGTPSPPSPVPIPSDSNLEMTWHTFAGSLSEALICTLQMRCLQENLGSDNAVLAHQLRLHLHRGIGYMAGDRHLRSIEDLLKLTAGLPVLTVVSPAYEPSFVLAPSTPVEDRHRQINPTIVVQRTVNPTIVVQRRVAIPKIARLAAAPKFSLPPGTDE